MHNLPFVVVKAEACDDVVDWISDWGTSDNCSSICGCVSEDDEVILRKDTEWTDAMDKYPYVKEYNRADHRHRYPRDDRRSDRTHFSCGADKQEKGVGKQ